MDIFNFAAASAAESDDVCALNLWRRPKTAAAQALIDDLVEETLAFEAERQLRQRARRLGDEERFRQVCSAIFADLCYRCVVSSEKWLLISRSNEVLGSKSRYQPSFVTPALRKSLDLIVYPGRHLVRQELGWAEAGGSGRMTKLSPLNRLRSRVAEAGLTGADFQRLKGEELLVLKDKDGGYQSRGRLIEYEETDETERLRQQVREINKTLAEADIALTDDACQCIDVTDRLLRRHFSIGQFDKGGRLFGGFWQQMSKEPRFQWITINGEPIVELDYGQINPHIAYGLNGIVPEPGDMYDIPGFEDRRDGVKKLFNALFWCKDRLKRFPKTIREEGLFPPWQKAQDVVAAIENRHPELVDSFGRAVGYDLMFEESKLLITVLEDLASRGVVALPIHDAVLVAQSDAETARMAMQAAFRDRFGFDCPVK